MAEKISENLIDDILNETKARQGIQPEKLYSTDEIDRLLAEINGSVGENSIPETKIVAPKAVFEKSEPSMIKKETEKPTKKGFSFDISKIQAFDDVEDESEDEISLLEEDDGQLEIVSTTGEINVSEVKDKEEYKDISSETIVIDVVEEEPKPVTGQISIEKTRMFNEVDIRGAYNPNISHNLGNKVARANMGDAEPLSSPVMQEEKYRKHFMNKPVQRLESTQEQRAIRNAAPQKTMETPGVVIKKGQAKENTDGISPMPTIVPAEYELEQGIKNLPFDDDSNEDVFDNQIMFAGFSDDEEILQQSEEQAEAELRENRKEIIKDFVEGELPFKQEVEEPVARKRYERQRVSVAREYFGPKDGDAVKKIFSMEKASGIAKLAVLSAICLTMTVLATVAGMDNGNFEIYGNNEFLYSLVQLFLLGIASAINYRSFINAFNNIKSLIVDMDTVVAVSALSGILQCVVSFAFTDSIESVAKLTAGAAVIPMILKVAGELVRCKNDAENFNILSDNVHNSYSVENIKDEDTANEIARGLMLGNPEIKYSAKIGFPQRFVELSRSAEITGAICKITLPAVAIIGLIFGVVAVAKTGNIFAAISAFTSTLLMGVPATAGFVSALNLRATNRILNEEGALINGYSAVEDAVNSNGVIVDACDAFEQGGCNIEGMKTYHKMRIDEAILYTASVVIASGGVLAEVFDGVIIGKRELLLPVESLAYEEKLGCSCWIHNHRVLVGNRDLLIHHNVETPDKDLEEKYKSNGRNVVYLAIEGKISAMFVVIYKANEETAKYMRELEKDGITIFFRTSDANITERFLEREFQLPENVVKIINPVAGDMFAKEKSQTADRSDAKIIHDGSIKSMLAAIHGAFVISSFVNSSRLMQIIASVIAVIIMAVFTVFSSLSQIGVWQIIFFHAIWTVILSVPAFTRKK